MNLQLLEVIQISSFLWGTAIPADVLLRSKYNITAQERERFIQ
jgi:hypothetical protein